mmetsp:Transcript_7138/g.15990  ORF Transcript_7138/g.15990 Transcript_7138/m.15990 type:complete len:235 (-) Transcript_7138:269-973(-)
MQVYHVTLCRVNRDAVQTQNQAFRASVARLSILQAQDGTMQTNLPPRAALMPSLQSVAAVAAYLAWWPHPSLKLHMDGQRCSTRKACVESPRATAAHGCQNRYPCAYRWPQAEQLPLAAPCVRGHAYQRSTRRALVGRASGGRGQHIPLQRRLPPPSRAAAHFPLRDLKETLRHATPLYRCSLQAHRVLLAYRVQRLRSSKELVVLKACAHSGAELGEGNGVALRLAKQHQQRE